MTDVNRPNVLVFGVGGAGTNTVSYLYEHQVQARCAVANIDALLKANPCPEKFFLGVPGLDSRVQKITENQARIEDCLRGARLVILVAGMGGSSTAACVEIARLAQNIGSRILCIAFMPLDFEKLSRRELAHEGIQQLREASVETVVVPTTDFIRSLPAGTSFETAYDVISAAVLELTNHMASLSNKNGDPANINELEELLEESVLATSVALLAGVT